MDYDCGAKCRSKHHVGQLVTAVTRATLPQAKLFLCRCHNTKHGTDPHGRTVLHMAASKGHTALVAWFLEQYEADLSCQDGESGWTALHRAAFYGQLASARMLIHHGAPLSTRDHEGLQPLDLTMKDRPQHASLNLGQSEVYTWGENSNSTLGHDNMQSRRAPELVEALRKIGMAVKQVSMSKYHSVFLCQSGRVYSCGHGRGGRLGHGHELTYLVPHPVETLKNEVCLQVATGRDHTLMLMESGAVFVCGLNDQHQLGQPASVDMCLQPRQLTGKWLRGRQIRGVCAQHQHSILYTNTEVFTFGLNEGQLGHKYVSGESAIPEPRVVSGLIRKDVSIQHVATCRAATVVATNKGEVYTLYEYQYRKIVSKGPQCVQVAVCGGTINPRMSADTRGTATKHELFVALLVNTGKVQIWRESQPYLSCCSWDVGRPLFVSYLALSLSSLAVVTNEGQLFTATLPESAASSKEAVQSPTKESAPVLLSSSLSMTLTELVARQDLLSLSLHQVPHIHRATAIIMDPKGTNMAALQTQPRAWLTEVPSVPESTMCEQLGLLLDEANEWDLSHDALLQVGSHRIAAHRYMLAYRSEYFRNLFTTKRPPGESDVAIVTISDVDYPLFLQMLMFIYTDSCDLLHVRRLLKDINLTRPDSTHQGVGEQSKSIGTPTTNPIKALQQMAKQFGVKHLVKRLEAVRSVDGRIQNVHGKHLAKPRMKLDRTKYPILHDIVIQGDSGEGLHCHRCVLVARLDYFKSMLGSGWQETLSSSTLKFPVPEDVLKVALDYLYTDEGPTEQACENVEFLCNVLVVADQLLISRLKEMCETAITAQLTLRNVGELLEFATMYNAPQLCASCQQFISLHVGALLETRALDVLSEEVVEELTQYYRETVPGMCRRLVTPYDAWPDASYLESLEATAQAAGDTGITSDTPTKRQKARRRRSRTKSSGDEADGDVPRRLSESRLSIGSDDALTEEVGETLADIQEHAPLPVSVGKEKVEVSTRGQWPGSPQTSPGLSPRTDTPGLGGSTPAAGSVGLRDIMALEEKMARAVQITPQISSKKMTRVSQKERKRQQQAALEAERRVAEQQPEQQATKKDSPRENPCSKKMTRVSQKERKRQQQAALEAERRVAEQQPEQQATKKDSPRENPWGSKSQSVPCFRDVLLDQGKHKPKKSPLSVTPQRLPSNQHSTGKPLSSGHSTTISWGMAPVQLSGPSSREEPTATVSSPEPAENPWSKPAASAGSTVQFSKIISDEKQQSDTLQKLINKPLALIQLEERAIQELRAHYRADEHTDEHITIERVPAMLAKPTWAAVNKPWR